VLLGFPMDKNRPGHPHDEAAGPAGAQAPLASDPLDAPLSTDVFLSLFDPSLDYLG
jgi:hypothetical protein